MPPLPDDKLPVDADPDSARVYMQAHDARAVHCDQMADRSLRLLYNASLSLRSMTLLFGLETWSHDELVNSIVALEFPDVQKARDIWYRHTRMPAIGQE